MLSRFREGSCEDAGVILYQLIMVLVYLGKVYGAAPRRQWNDALREGTILEQPYIREDLNWKAEAAKDWRAEFQRRLWREREKRGVGSSSSSRH